LRIALVAGLAASGLFALLVFSAQPAEAASMTFTTDTTISAYVTVEANEVLTINPGVTVTIRNAGIINHGTINNYGTINNHYLILNKPTGTINNNGIINNYDIFNTDPMSTTNNFGTFNNYYNVNNFGTINNYGIFNHYYGNSIGNYGLFNNYCGATFIEGGGLDGDEPIVSIPCPTIESLLGLIRTMDIPNSSKTSLNAPLNQALALLNDDNPNNDKAVCGKLHSFVGQVNAKAGKGLTTDQAQELLEIASAIKDDLTC
jgi:hypothetical protein